MTHPPEVRQEALARIAGGESMRSVAKALGVDVAQISRWNQAAGEVIATVATPVRERIGNDYMLASVKCVERTLELLPHQDSVRDTAYAAKVLADAGMKLLGWVEPKDQAGTVINNFGSLSLTEIDARIAQLQG